MSGTTVELNLATAVDADDNADYLTISLANSLRTVDGLFNSVTGHTHGGAHQGGPVAIPDGSIQAVDIANGAVTNAKLASDTARANLLTNGGFENWQRGVGPFSTHTAFAADRWSINIAGTDTLSISKDTTNMDVMSASCAVATCTVGTGAGLTDLRQFLRVSDGAPKNCQLSVSLRVKTATANAVHIMLFSDGTGGNNSVYSAFHTGGGTYQTLTTTQTIPADATLIGVLIRFAASCTAYLDNAMLVVGSVPADYAPLHPADDLARCLRYYEVLTTASGAALFPGFDFSTTQMTWVWPYKVAKAVTPTITMPVPANSSVLNAAGTPLGCSSVTGGTTTASQATGYAAVTSGLLAGNATQLVANAGFVIGISAEGNP